MKFGNETEIMIFSPKHRNRPPRLNMTIINVLSFLIEDKKLFRLIEIRNIAILINPPRKMRRATSLTGPPWDDCQANFLRSLRWRGSLIFVSRVFLHFPQGWWDLDAFDPDVARDEGEEEGVDGVGMTTWSFVAEVDQGRLEVFVPVKGVDGAEVEREDVGSTSACLGDTIPVEKVG
jgi:hypothetical protein